MVRAALREKQIFQADELVAAALAPPETIMLAHLPAYVEAICNGSVDSKLMRRIGFPWSYSLVRRSLATVGGTIAAAEEALVHRAAGNLAGGTHHAMADGGEGFCVFNDIAIAIMYLRKQRAIRRAAIIDLDVHQGNGNSAILGALQDVFIFSMHGEKNYPFRKIPSTLDIDLADGVGDEEYLAALRAALPQVLAFQPQIIFYQAGVDALQQDTLGRLSLSLAGLAARDRLVFSQCQQAGIPICTVLGGGYAKPIDLTVAAHVQTYTILKEVFKPQ